MNMIRHIDAERRAGDLEFRVKVRTLFRRDLDRTRHERDADGRFAGPRRASFFNAVSMPGIALSAARALLSERVDIVVLAEVGKFLVRLVRERQLASAAVGRIVLVICLYRVFLPAIAAANEMAW